MKTRRSKRTTASRKRQQRKTKKVGGCHFWDTRCKRDRDERNELLRQFEMDTTVLNSTNNPLRLRVIDHRNARRTALGLPLATVTERRVYDPTRSRTPIRKGVHSPYPPRSVRRR